MKSTLRVLAWIYFIVLTIITLPIGLSIYWACSVITFHGDDTPRLWTWWSNLLTWPFTKIKYK